MAKSLRFPIRYKILAVLSAVVVAAVAAYLYLASRLFFEDKTLLIYELNQSNVRTLSTGLETDIKRVLDKLKLIAKLSSSATPGDKSAKFSRILSQTLMDEDELVKVSVIDLKAKKSQQSQFSHIWPKYLETYKKSATYLDHLQEVLPLPLEKIAARGLWVRNATLSEENAPPLLIVATTISSSETRAPEKIITAIVRLDRILEPFSSAGIAHTYAVDSEGHILADSIQERVLHADLISNDVLIKTALASKVRSEVKRFTEGEHSYLGSYYQVGLANIAVASKVETGEAFAAAYLLIRKSIIYAAVVVTAAFLIALIFSHSLTAPIQQMLEATQRIAKGDFSNLIRISSRDEIAVLASSFNTMTVDLKSSREQIEEYSRDLEKKVKDRTLQLEKSNIAIKEAQEALVRTTRLASVGEIAGRAAHEVLNPLTNVTARLERMRTTGLKADLDDVKFMREIINAWTDELKTKGSEGLFRSLEAKSQTLPGKTLLDEDLENLVSVTSDFVQRFVDRDNDIDFLLKEAIRINKIVNNMRQLTRMSGNLRPIRIHDILDEALNTMKDVMGKHKIRTETKYTDQLPIVMADHDELLQVFSNLFRNSMQAIDEAQKAGDPVGAPPKVWITTETSGEKVLIRVCDNGPGIRPEDTARIFESSFTTKSTEEGTGLGLSITRRFIRAFKGEIILEKSIPGSETVFLIELPMMEITNANGN